MAIPQTHVSWHRVAPALAQHFSVVVADLRGYGASSIPASDPDHHAYSKRVMAQDCVDLMQALGHDRFALVGHDRGGRVGYRLALDHPQALTRLALLDILPTHAMWQRMNHPLAMSAYHWLFLAQPRPLPETLIAKAPYYYLEHTLASWARDKDLSAFDANALAHYRALFDNVERIHAMCEDYRAGETRDNETDAADLQAGNKIACPTLVLSGTDYVAKRAGTPLDIWRDWCDDVQGEAIVSGHFLAEEAPDDVLRLVEPFLRGT